MFFSVSAAPRSFMIQGLLLEDDLIVLWVLYYHVCSEGDVATINISLPIIIYHSSQCEDG